MVTDEGNGRPSPDTFRTDIVLQLTRLGGPVFALNPDLIERAEATPDTVITLVGGNAYVVRESLLEVSSLIRNHRAEVIAQAHLLGVDTAYATEAVRARPRAAVDPSAGRRAGTGSPVVTLYPQES